MHAAARYAPAVMSSSYGGRRTRPLCPPGVPRGCFDPPKDVFMQMGSVRWLIMIEPRDGFGAVGENTEERGHEPR